MARKITLRKGNKIFQQYSSGAWLGGIKTVLQSTLFYFTALNFLMLIWLSIKDTSFSAVLRDFVSEHIPWFNFPVFLAIAVVVILVSMWVEYKFIIPSSWEFSNWQFYKHNNPMQVDLQKIMRMERKTAKRLDAIEEKLGIEKKFGGGKRKC